MRWSFVFGLVLLASNYAFAVNTASFSVEGTITGSTCKVVVGDGELISIAYQNQSKLKAPNSVAGKTPFRISVTGCATTASVFFQNDQSTVNKTGRLINTAEPGVDGGAENVELEILDWQGKSINLSAAQGVQGTSPATSGAIQGSANFDYFVQYFSLGAATAGKVKSSLTFVVDSF
ncbi:MAG: fimbrial protein [Pseudomonas sp.]